MSCFILSHESTRRIAHTLADILDAVTYGNTCTIATDAARASDLQNAFAQYYNPRKGYNAEAIAADLYRLNTAAYNGRYRENELPTMLPSLRHSCTIYKQAEYTQTGRGMSEAPQEWHFHLVKLLDCYLYQTAEDATSADPLRKSLKAFNASLMAGIIHHSPAYDLHQWGV